MNGFIFEVGYFEGFKKNYLIQYIMSILIIIMLTLIRLLFKIGFSIKNISLNETQGGTIRIVLKKKN